MEIMDKVTGYTGVSKVSKVVVDDTKVEEKIEKTDWSNFDFSSLYSEEVPKKRSKRRDKRRRDNYYSDED